ncbi:MAG TPA: polyprenyl synthetase family protein [Acidimicrobiales bacterium]|nr:polyprenyl synthetase family protein [Acidimicrobiales bacterium]
MTAIAVPDVLARARDAVQPAMVAAIDGLNPELRPVAAYHLGWCDERGAPTSGGGGKGVRPALALLSAEAAGADAGTGIPGAVAVELVHNFSLLHDDVIDGDRERRHRPTVWALYGIGPAVIVGDALVALAHQTLQRSGSPGAADANAALTDAVAAMIAGQAEDMAFEGRAHVTAEECLGMVAGKTGALLACASAIGARLAGAPPAMIEALGSYGAHLGVAFQAVDDLLGIWGDPERTGKPRGSDLATRKKSLPVVHALASPEPAAGELRALLANGPLDAGAVARGSELVEAGGGRCATEALARRHLDAACRALELPELVPAACAELTDLARFVVEREF